MSEINDRISRHYGWSGLMNTIEEEIRRERWTQRASPSIPGGRQDHSPIRPEAWRMVAHAPSISRYAEHRASWPLDDGIDAARARGVERSVRRGAASTVRELLDPQSTPTWADACAAWTRPGTMPFARECARR